MCHYEYASLIARGQPCETHCVLSDSVRISSTFLKVSALACWHVLTALKWILRQ